MSLSSLQVLANNRQALLLAEGGPPPEAIVPGPSLALTPAWPSWEFESFDELVQLADQVAQQLTKGGAG